MANAKGQTLPNTEESSVATETEEESQESQSSEGVEETEESGESAGAEEEKEEEESPEQYLEIAKVPAPLQAIARKMQATHTKKMQALALDSRKAAALDDLVSHPSWAPFLADLEAGKPYGASTRLAAKEVVESDEETETSDGKVSMKKLLDAILPAVEEMVNQKTAPLITERAQETYERVRELHIDDFDDYLPEITKLQKAFPKMSLERAYVLAKAESSPEPRKPTKEEIKKVKGARTLGAGAAKGSTGEVKPQTVKTLRDALRHAFAAQGVRVE